MSDNFRVIMGHTHFKRVCEQSTHNRAITHSLGADGATTMSHCNTTILHRVRGQGLRHNQTRTRTPCTKIIRVRVPVIMCERALVHTVLSARGCCMLQTECSHKRLRTLTRDSIKRYVCYIYFLTYYSFGLSLSLPLSLSALCHHIPPVPILHRPAI